MKKSELRATIKEEIKKVLKESLYATITPWDDTMIFYKNGYLYYGDEYSSKRVDNDKKMLDLFDLLPNDDKIHKIFSQIGLKNQQKLYNALSSYLISKHKWEKAKF